MLTAQLWQSKSSIKIVRFVWFGGWAETVLCILWEAVALPLGRPKVLSLHSLHQESVLASEVSFVGEPGSVIRLPAANAGRRLQPGGGSVAESNGTRHAALAQARARAPTQAPALLLARAQARAPTQALALVLARARA